MWESKAKSAKIRAPEDTAMSLRPIKIKHLVCEATEGQRGTLSWRLDEATTGRSWDLSARRDVQQVKALLKSDGVHLLRVSPPAERHSQERAKTLSLIQHAVELCMCQERLGRAWTFEHPAQSPAWSHEVMSPLMCRSTATY